MHSSFAFKHDASFNVNADKESSLESHHEVDSVKKRLEEERSKTAFLRKHIQRKQRHPCSNSRVDSNTATQRIQAAYLDQEYTSHPDASNTSSKIGIGERNTPSSLSSSLLFKQLMKEQFKSSTQNVGDAMEHASSPLNLMKESANSILSSLPSSYPSSINHMERSAWDVLTPSSIQHVCGTNDMLSNILYWHGEHTNSFPISDFSSSIAESLWKTLPPFEAHVADLCIQALSRLEAYSVRKRQISSTPDSTPQSSSVSKEVVSEVFLHVRIDPTTGYPVVTDNYDSRTFQSWASGKTDEFSINNRAQSQHSDEDEKSAHGPFENDLVSFEVWFVAKPTLGLQCAGQIKLPYDIEKRIFLQTGAWSFTANGPKRLNKRGSEVFSSKKPFYPRIADTYLVATPKITESFVPYTEAWKRAIQSTKARMKASKSNYTEYESMPDNYSQNPLYDSTEKTNEMFMTSMLGDDPHQFDVLRQSHTLGIPSRDHLLSSWSTSKDDSQPIPESSQRSVNVTGTNLFNALSGNATRRLSIGGAYAKSGSTGTNGVAPIEGLDDLRKTIRLRNQRSRNPFPPPQPPPQPEPPLPKCASSSASSSGSEGEKSGSEVGLQSGPETDVESDEEMDMISTGDGNGKSEGLRSSQSTLRSNTDTNAAPQTPAYPGQATSIVSATTPWGWLVSPGLECDSSTAQQTDGVLNVIPQNIREAVLKRNSPMLAKANEIPLLAASSALRTYLTSSENSKPVSLGSEANLEKLTKEDLSNAQTTGHEKGPVFYQTIPSSFDKESGTSFRSKTPPRVVSHANPLCFTSHSAVASAASVTTASDDTSRLYAPSESVRSQRDILTASSQSRSFIEVSDKQAILKKSSSKSSVESPLSLINCVESGTKQQGQNLSTKIGSFMDVASGEVSSTHQSQVKESIQTIENIGFPSTLKTKLLSKLWQTLSVKLRRRKIKRAANLMAKIKRISESSQRGKFAHGSSKSPAEVEVSSKELELGDDKDFDEEHLCSVSNQLDPEELKAYLPSEPLPHLNYCFRHKLVHEMRILELINCVLRGYQHLISTSL